MGIKNSLDAHGLSPRKKWGQNFLTDPRILSSIADAGHVDGDDWVLEIGPGLGHLTRVLASRAGHIVAVEIDEQLASKLQHDLADSPNVAIVNGDILERAPAEWITVANASFRGSVRGFKVIANLPYYITSAILRHILEATVKPTEIVVMVQREVAQRMIAKPPDMNLLALSVQLFTSVHIVRTIAPGAFYPRPKVESAVVWMQVLPQPRVAVDDPHRFFELIRAGFGEKRKQLRNSLSRGLNLDPIVTERLLRLAHVDPKRRAETLALDEWRTVYLEWSKLVASHGNQG